MLFSTLTVAPLRKGTQNLNLSQLLFRTTRTSSLRYQKKPTLVTRSWLSTEGARLNSTNLYHDSQEQPPQEWTVFHGKIPVLQEKEFTQEEPVRTSLLMTLTDQVGILSDILKFFWKYDVNICRIESRPSKDGYKGKQFDFFVDLEGSEGDQNVSKLIRALRPMVDKLLVLDEKQVTWFPRHISELDLIANRTLDAGTDLQSDHPGFNDTLYRKRREMLATKAINHRWNKPIENIAYTSDEIETWSAVWEKITDLLEKHACKEYLHSMQLMKKYCGYSRDNIPQQQNISNFLLGRTNFRLRPVAGLLSSRDFLNGLAFRVFFCTQYIRHHSMPLYTPEPDICHELLGHAPMFADRDFADFSQEIGLASLGASDEDINRLARCYWHSVEFGLCKENGENKAYGAGLLSSFGELEYACSEEHPGAEKPPKILPWDPETASHTEFPITTYQPTYFLAESLQDAKQKMRNWCENLPRPFFATYNEQNETVHIDRPVVRCRGVPRHNV